MLNSLKLKSFSRRQTNIKKEKRNNITPVEIKYYILWANDKVKENVCKDTDFKYTQQNVS